MKGTILGMPNADQKGVISASTGDRYKFKESDVRSEKPLAVGDNVDFDTLKHVPPISKITVVCMMASP